MAENKPSRATVKSVKGELDTAIKQISDNEKAQTELSNELISTQQNLSKVEKDLDALQKLLPAFDQSCLTPLKNQIGAVDQRTTAVESQLATAESNIDSVKEATKAAKSSAVNAAREADRLRANLHLTWGAALILAIAGYICWTEATGEETEKPLQITSGDILAIVIDKDDEEQRAYVEVQVDGTIQDVCDDTRLNVAGLEFELARRLVEAHVQSVIPMATVSLRRATDDEVAKCRSMKMQKDDDERDDDERDDDERDDDERDDDERDDDERDDDERDDDERDDDERDDDERDDDERDDDEREEELEGQDSEDEEELDD